MKNLLKFMLFLSSVMLAACGGGGGGGGGTSDGPRFSISDESIEFRGITGSQVPDAQTVVGTVTGTVEGNIYIVVVLTGSGVVADAQVSISGKSGRLLIFPGDPDVLGEGTHHDSITVNVCTNANCTSHISGSPRTINVTYEVTYVPTISDSDGDGTADAFDALPNNPNETADHDLDGVGNNEDVDDDNDGVHDSTDPFPFDGGEWADSDGDLIGDNSDNNDDNDFFEDAEDPLPLNGSAPGILSGVSPGFVIAGQPTKVLLSGLQLSHHDTFYVNGEIIDDVIISSKAAEIELTANTPGTLEIAIEYSESDYNSSVELPVISALYYPYAVLRVGGDKPKAYFDPLTQSLFVYNGTLALLSRHQYAEGGAWQTESLPIAGIKSIGLSRDNKILAALKADSLLEIDIKNFHADASHPINMGPNTFLSDIEFDYAKTAVMVTGYNGSGATGVTLYDMNPDSDTYGTQSGLGQDLLYNSAIAASGDGRMVLLGAQDLSPIQPLKIHSPVTDSYHEAGLEINYRSASIDMRGNLVLLNDTELYKNNFMIAGNLDTGGTITAAAVHKSGNFVIAADSNQQLHWFDTSDYTGGPITPDHSADITEEAGTVHEVVISDDGLTVLVLGDNQILVVPVWQIVEDSIGSAAVCPADGCGGIPVSTGVSPEDDSIIVPPFDMAESPAKHISPTYAGIGHRFEALITGTGFTPASVVQFDGIPATDVTYVSDTELRVALPALDEGTYLVTVDGHRTNAPTFSVVTQKPIVETFWSMDEMTGFHRELVYDPVRHMLYGLTRNSQLYRIALPFQGTVTQAVPNANDLTWCPEDNYLYVVTGGDVIRHDPDTLEPLGTVATGEIERLECVAENKLVLTYGSSFPDYAILDIDQNTLSEFFTEIINPSVDGVSRRGDFVYFSSTSSPADRALLRPHQPSVSVILNQGQIFSSNWSDDGGLGVVNSSVLNGYFSKLGEIELGAISATAVSPDGTKIYVFVEDTINLIELDPENFSGMVVTASRNITDDIGGVHRAVTSLDGNTVFAAGANGVIAVNF